MKRLRSAALPILGGLCSAISSGSAVAAAHHALTDTIIDWGQGISAPIGARTYIDTSKFTCSNTAGCTVTADVTADFLAATGQDAPIYILVCVVIDPASRTTPIVVNPPCANAQFDNNTVGASPFTMKANAQVADGAHTIATYVYVSPFAGPGTTVTVESFQAEYRFYKP
jgi:hypothetical protein